MSSWPIHCWQVTKNIYDSKAIAEEINNLYSQISNIYKNIAIANFMSAIQKVEASERSKSPEIKINDAIGHLQNAFNLLELALKEKTTRRSLFFFKESSPVITKPEKCCFFCAHLAGLIVILYKSLGECANSEEWLKKAGKMYDIYLNDFEISTDELMLIDPGFVEEYISEDTIHSTFPGIDDVTIDKIEYCRTEQGFKYINLQKKNIHKTFLNSITTRTFLEFKGLAQVQKLQE